MIVSKEIINSQNPYLAYPPSVLMVSEKTSEARNLKQQLENHGCYVQQVDLEAENLGSIRQNYFELIIVNLDELETCCYQDTYNKLSNDPKLAGTPLMILSQDCNINAVTAKLTAGSSVYCLAKDGSTEVRILQIIEQIHYMTYRYM